MQGLYRRRRRGCTVRRPGCRVADDLVDRQFAADAPNRLWVTDIERHEALCDRVEVRGLRRWPVAAGRVKLRAA